ncbi:MAG TPA: ATPase [Bacteroidetes bacterium]|nr:ATPase [Bacteroidota bacterium]
MQPKTIVITGPESTGKTTLAGQLAAHFKTVWVPEFARSYISGLDRQYIENDLLEIAKGQLLQENKMKEKAGGVLFLDTSLEVLKIWSGYKYGRCHPFILDQLKAQKHRLYLLCEPDIKWEKDPQRENPDDRQKLFELYVQELTQQNTNFVKISGIGNTRFKNALHYVRQYLSIHAKTDAAQ